MSNFKNHIIIGRKQLLLTILILFFIFPWNNTISYAAEEAALEETKPLAITVTIKHQHTGSKDRFGGCYTKKKTQTETQEKPCGGTMVYYPATDTTGCDKCGAGYSGDQSGRECWTTYPQEVSNTYYELDCGKNQGAAVGSLTLTKSTQDWTKELTLTASYENTGGMKIGKEPYIWNGEKSEQAQLKVTENRTCTLQLNADGNSNTKNAVITAEITNIDTTAPVTDTWQLMPQDWTKEGVTFQALQVRDIQPTGGEGSGLHELPYSYDEGKTWEKEGTKTYTENGTCQVWVRDCLENYSVTNFTISNIDKTGPAITKKEYDHRKNLAAASLTLEAVDLQKNGEAGSGLHEKPYSFDGGQTWGAGNICSVKSSRPVKLAVRDKVGNITYDQETVNNIDSTGPQIWHVLVPDYWTNGTVTACFYAKDMNPDGTEGVGLAPESFSFDGGRSWSSEGEETVGENRQISVLAKDLYGNTSACQIQVTNIDKIPPTAEVTCEPLDETGQQVLIRVKGKDGESGLHEAPYSYDGGNSHTAADQYTVGENGEYQIQIRDKAGNSTVVTANVDQIRKKEKAKKPVVTPKAGPEEKEPKKTEAVKRLPILAKEAEPAEQKQVKKQMGLTDMLLLTFGIFAGILATALLLFLWTRSIAVYVETEDGKFRFLGREWIHDRGNGCYVKLSDFIWNQCMTTHFQFRPSWFFVKLHKNDEIYFLFPKDRNVSLPVERVMETVLL